MNVLLAIQSTKKIWCQNLFAECRQIQLGPTILFSNNQSVASLVVNSKYHSCTKHIDINFYFIYEKILNEIIQIIFVQTLPKIDNILTKGL